MRLRSRFSETSGRKAWTDLYALGATIWTWLSGRPMFMADERAVLLERHLASERPEPPRAEGMPEAARVWLARLVSRDIDARPQHAAHAAAELRAIVQRERHELWSWGSTPKLERSTTLRRDASDVQLRGLGMELVALREPNLQGRTEAQGELVDALAAALAPHPQRPRTLGLSCSAAGEAEHVATWLCRAADEQGVARMVHVADPPEPAALVARALATDEQGIALPAARAWLCRDLPGEILRDLELIADMPEAKASLEAAARILIAVAMKKPLVLSGHGAAARDWIKSVCERAPSEARLAAVLSSDTTDEAYALPPLSLLALVRTLRDLVGLDGRSADAIAERAQGSTRALVRLVIELQQRGALVEGPRGLVARDEAVMGALLESSESLLRATRPASSSTRSTWSRSPTAGRRVGRREVGRRGPRGDARCVARAFRGAGARWPRGLHHRRARPGSLGSDHARRGPRSVGECAPRRPEYIARGADPRSTDAPCRSG